MTVVDVRKTGKWAKKLIIKCDECNVIFERRNTTEMMLKQLHFCSIKCVNELKKNGHALQTAFEREHGVTNNFARRDVIDKIKNTMIQR